MPASDPWALDLIRATRLLRLAVVIGNNPGISRDELYEEFRAEFPDERSSASTINNALRDLKAIGLLAARPQRTGYFLTDRAIDKEEQEAILVALRIHGVDLGNPHARAIHEALVDRLIPGAEQRTTMAYPVEAIGQRRVVNTEEERLARFMDDLREPIRRGAALRIQEVINPYTAFHETVEHLVFPLQLYFYNVAWYLLVEYVEPTSRRFHVLRVERVAPMVDEALSHPRRGTRRQQQSLAEARAAMAFGWDAAIPDSIEAHQLMRVKLRFAREVAHHMKEVREDFRAFADIPDPIREATRIVRRPHGEALIVELTIADQLPVQSEFQRWLATWGAGVEVLEPASLRQQMLERHLKAAQRYDPKVRRCAKADGLCDAT